MILLVDIGNTNITFGAYGQDKYRFVSRMATDRLRTTDEYAVCFERIIGLYHADALSFNGAVISSVVPELTSTVEQAIQKITGSKPLVLTSAVKTDLKIEIDNPSQLGGDLLAAAVGAKAQYPLPCLILDLGTATKISVVDKDGVYRGCTITAGIGISLQALSSKTSQLPAMSLEKPEHVIGTNTITSMQSGVVLGTAAMLDGMCARIEKELGTKVKSIVATGGLSGVIVPHCERKVIHDDNLILSGLAQIYKLNLRAN